MLNQNESIILIVDDQPTNLKMLFSFLQKSGFKVLVAKSGESAIKKLRNVLPDLIILDVLMPGIDGFETCRLLKASRETQNIPVIFMTALSEVIDKIKGLKIGAVDYITKPFQSEEVLASIENQLKLSRLQKQLQEQNKQLQQEISDRQQSQALLASVLNTSLDGVAAFAALRDSQGKIIDFIWLLLNPAGEKMLGRQANELLGKQLLVELPEICETELFEKYVSVVETGEALETELYYVCENIQSWWQMIAVKLNDGLAVTYRDITARKQADSDIITAKAALEQQIQRAVLLGKITQEIRSSLNPEKIFQTATTQVGKALSVNRCMIHTYIDYPTPQISFAFEYKEPDRASTQDFEIPVVGNPYAELLLTQDSAFAADNVYTNPLLKATSSQYHWLGLKSMLAVRTSYQEKPNGIICVHQYDSFRHWRDEEIELLEAVAAQVGIAIAQANLLEQETKQRQELAAQNHALEKAKLEAEAANCAKSEFLSKMSHELRTPLNVILGFTQVMACNRSLTQEQTEQLGMINSSGEHLLGLINDILSLSKIEAGRVTLNENSFDLYRLLDKLEEMLRLKANSKNLNLIFQRTLDLPQYIETDEGKLCQVLINLLGNSIKFTQSGTVTLRASLASGKEQRHSLEFSNQDNRQIIYFEIEDTGPGIPSEEMSTLFDPFVQTQSGRQSMEGTGLGLPISQQFVRLMGGDIIVNSTFGQGAIFRFNIQAISIPNRDLYRTIASTINTVTHRTSDEFHSNGNGYNLVTLERDNPLLSKGRIIGLDPNQPVHRILVVEDVVENCQLLVTLLESLGFEVRAAANGQEGVTLWESWSPHLILMDILMPIMDGKEATRQIKRSPKGQNTIIIALTASAFEEQRKAILKAGCDAFMCKPIQIDILLEKIAKHLGVRYLYKNSAGLAISDLQ